MLKAPSAKDLALTEKALLTFHLSALEKRALSDGKIKLSNIYLVIAACLQKHPFFPPNWDLDMPFNGVLLEQKTPHEFILHYKVEVTVGNHKIMRVEKYHDLQAAITQFIKSMFDKAIDGVTIDMGS